MGRRQEDKHLLGTHQGQALPAVWHAEFLSFFAICDDKRTSRPRPIRAWDPGVVSEKRSAPLLGTQARRAGGRERGDFEKEKKAGR